MNVIVYISEFIIPLIVFAVLIHAMVKKRPVYEDFTEGAVDGIKTVYKILPTLIGLMIGIKVISASGLLKDMANLLSHATKYIGIPSQVIPVVVVRFFSSSAATGLCLDVFEQYGPDSYSGYMVSILMSCTETIFYTLSVYCMAAKVSKTRWTLAGAFIATIVGIVASVVLSVIRTCKI